MSCDRTHRDTASMMECPDCEFDAQVAIAMDAGKSTMPPMQLGAGGMNDFVTGDKWYDFVTGDKWREMQGIMVALHEIFTAIDYAQGGNYHYAQEGLRLTAPYLPKKETEDEWIY